MYMVFNIEPVYQQSSRDPDITFCILLYQVLHSLPEHLLSLLVLCGTGNYYPIRITWYCFQYFAVPGTAYTAGAPGISCCSLWYHELLTQLEYLVQLSVFCNNRNCTPFQSTLYYFQYFVVRGTACHSGAPGITFSNLQYQKLPTIPDHLRSPLFSCGISFVQS